MERGPVRTGVYYRMNKLTKALNARKKQIKFFKKEMQVLHIALAKKGVELAV